VWKDLNAIIQVGVFGLQILLYNHSAKIKPESQIFEVAT